METVMQQLVRMVQLPGKTDSSLSSVRRPVIESIEVLSHNAALVELLNSGCGGKMCFDFDLTDS